MDHQPVLLMPINESALDQRLNQLWSWTILGPGAGLRNLVIRVPSDVSAGAILRHEVPEHLQNADCPCPIDA
jgi:hypothetical protein